MSSLKKNLRTKQTVLVTILILISIIVPTFGSLQEAESFIVYENYDQAIAVLEPLVAQNNPHALYLLSYIYLSPKSDHLDFDKGVPLLEKAVSLNYAPAIDELAGLYLVGDGVEKSEERALSYYEQGAQMGYGPSQFNSGIMYKEGQGTTIDFAKAYFYLCMASLNIPDLGEVTKDAAKFRDEVVPFLSPEVRQDILRKVTLLTLPKKSRNEKS